MDRRQGILDRHVQEGHGSHICERGPRREARGGYIKYHGHDKSTLSALPFGRDVDGSASFGEVASEIVMGAPEEIEREEREEGEESEESESSDESESEWGDNSLD